MLGMVLSLCHIPWAHSWHSTAEAELWMGEPGSLPCPARARLSLAASSPCLLCPMTCPNAGRVPSGAAP